MLGTGEWAWAWVETSLRLPDNKQVCKAAEGINHNRQAGWASEKVDRYLKFGRHILGLGCSKIGWQAHIGTGLR